MNIPQKINCEELIQKLWCGTLEELTHDMLNHNIKTLINVEDSGIKKRYSVKFLRVSEFKLLMEHPEADWDYVELTQIFLKQEKDLYLMTCELWSSGIMSILCQDIEFFEY